jgi:hypothetical protein
MKHWKQIIKESFIDLTSFLFQLTNFQIAKFSLTPKYFT